MDPMMDTPPEWSGELDAIKAMPWWERLPADIRPEIEAGLKAKYAQWQSGHQKRFAAMDAAMKGAHEAASSTVAERMAELQAQLDEANGRAGDHEKNARLYSEWFANDPDAVDPEAHAALMAEVEDLRHKHSDHEGEKAEWSARFAEIERERDDHKAYRAGREQADLDDATAKGKAEGEKFCDDNKDVLDNEDACEMLHMLVDKQDMDPDEAVTKVRKLMKMTAAAEVAQPPVAAVIVAEVKPEPKPEKPKGSDPLDVMSGGDVAPGGFGNHAGEYGNSSRDIRAAAGRAYRLHMKARGGI
jgi:hypothetical protein